MRLTGRDFDRKGKTLMGIILQIQDNLDTLVNENFTNIRYYMINGL